MQNTDFCFRNRDAQKTLEESFEKFTRKKVFCSKLIFLVFLVTHCFNTAGGSVNYEALTN